MPTASTESSDKKGAADPASPMNQVMTFLEKRIRNLEKRKKKLDAIQVKLEAGDHLETAQKTAINHYDDVVVTIEYSKELQKQFTLIQDEANKMLKKQQKEQKQLRHQHEMNRIEELLRIQNLLDSLGSETVREDFKTGKHGAVVLSEENLQHLDEFYHLICPSREGEESYHEKLKKATGHIVALLDGHNKPVVGTTYKQVKKMINLVGHCGYFEKIKKLKAEGTDKPEEETKVEDEVLENPEAVSSEEAKTESQTSEPIGEFSLAQTLPDSPLEQVVPSPLNSMLPDTNPGFYAAEVYEAPQYRPIDEIVSAVQGSFNFLQESTIDVDPVQHSDPAVVAAQPMSRPLAQQTRDPEPRQLSGFGAQTFDHQNDPTSTARQPNTIAATSMTLQPHDQAQFGTQDLPLSQQTLDYASTQSFHQNALSQNLQNESLFPTTAEDTSAMSHSMMAQTGPNSSIGQFEMPAPQDGQQSNIANQSEKKFTMNAAAPVFQSQYSQYSQDQMGDGPSQTPPNTDSANTSNYQSNRYQNDGFQQRGPRREGGGYRGRGGRGGAGGGGNGSGRSDSVNGYNRNSGSGQSSRGGRAGPYQGYPPRSNYQPDGYQGYSSSGGNGGGGFNQGYKQRGGNNQGPMRGSNNGGGNMRGSGGMRGGSSRGSGGNSGQRAGGGPRSGFGRPNASQYQQ